jgi:[ribosomal protein S18]-alanine N-acetyltransferase
MSAEGIVIERLSGEEDLEAVAALEAASFTNPWTRAALERELGRSEVAQVYVLRLPGWRVAAFCAFWIVYDEMHVNTIAVEPALRRQGLARALMQHLLAMTATAGVERTFLEVRQSNDAARRLYENLGFRVAGLRRSYYTQPEEDAIVLVRHALRDAEEAGADEGPG